MGWARVSRVSNLGLTAQEPGQGGRRGAQRERRAPGLLITARPPSRAHLCSPPDNAGPVSSSHLSCFELQQKRVWELPGRPPLMTPRTDQGALKHKQEPQRQLNRFRRTWAGRHTAFGLWLVVPCPRPLALRGLGRLWPGFQAMRWAAVGRNLSSIHPMRSGLRGDCRERRLAYISGLRGVPSRLGGCVGDGGWVTVGGRPLRKHLRDDGGGR